jgi:hypothetical protein
MQAARARRGGRVRGDVPRRALPASSRTCLGRGFRIDLSIAGDPGLESGCRLTRDHSQRLGRYSHLAGLCGARRQAVRIESVGSSRQEPIRTLCPWQELIRTLESRMRSISCISSFAPLDSGSQFGLCLRCPQPALIWPAALTHSLLRLHPRRRGEIRARSSTTTSGRQRVRDSV